MARQGEGTGISHNRKYSLAGRRDWNITQQEVRSSREKGLEYHTIGSTD